MPAFCRLTRAMIIARCICLVNFNWFVPFPTDELIIEGEVKYNQAGDLTLYPAAPPEKIYMELNNTTSSLLI